MIGPIRMLAGIIAVAGFVPATLSAEDGHKMLTEQSRAIITDYAKMRAQGLTYEAHHKHDAQFRIEHDPWVPDGLGGDEKFIEERKAAAPEKYDSVDRYVNILHTLVTDGDLVAIKSHMFTSAKDPGRLFVDIWRLENGKIAEHWDVIEPIEADPANPMPVGCGVGSTYEAARLIEDPVGNPACGNPDPSGDREANRKLVLDYMEMGMQAGRLAEAVNTYVAEDFRQHSARIPPGRQQLIDYLEPRMAARRADNHKSVIGRVLADGDMVLVHRWTSSDSDPRGTAVVDLFRLKDGKIVDHWDVMQRVPPFSVAGRSMVGDADTPLEPDRVKGLATEY